MRNLKPSNSVSCDVCFVWVIFLMYKLLTDLFDDVVLMYLKIEGAAGFVPPKAIRIPGTKRVDPPYLASIPPVRLLRLYL